ncbi:hypothetical protein D4R71_03030 [bacterium]|nr:MAG: hypothetical protein D4R71_03030 [bacterium]
MSTDADKILSNFYKGLNLDVKSIVIFILSYLYSAGYLIQAATLRNFGIYRLETIKFQYIEVGFTFTVLALLVTVVPVGLYLAHFRIRQKSGLLHYKIGAIGFLINTYNLFLIIVFFAMFITWKEWSLVIFQSNSSNLQITLYQAFLIYLAVALILLIFFPLLERLVMSKFSRPKLIYNFFIEPFRFFAVLFAIMFDLLLLHSFPWIRTLILGGLAFLGTTIMLVGIIFVIGYYMRKLGDERSLHVLAAIGSTGVIVILFICINAYVFSIIRYIPMNRGGKLPITRSYLMSDKSVFNNIPINKSKFDEGTKLGPLYVIEETKDYLYVTNESDGSWYRDWASTCAIRKDVVQYIQNERITKGGPRQLSQ